VIRRILPLAGILGGLVLAAPAAASPAASGCQIQATMATTIPVNLLSGAFNYTLDGQFSNCTGTLTGASAKISTGTTITIAGVAYKPIDAGLGGGVCHGMSLTGPAVVQWTNGGLSVFDSTANLGYFRGPFRSGSVTLQRTTPDPLNPAHTSDTFPLLYGGTLGEGAVTVTPPDPSLCAGAGSKAFDLNGGFGIFATS
jgi:hypothetical protein